MTHLLSLCDVLYVQEHWLSDDKLVVMNGLSYMHLVTGDRCGGELGNRNQWAVITILLTRLKVKRPEDLRGDSLIQINHLSTTLYVYNALHHL